MLSCWLRIRSIIEADEFSTKIKTLHRTAKSVGMTAMWRVQREHRRVPILLGPIVPADIMLSAFRSACSCFKVVMHNLSCESVEDHLEPPDFDWGDSVEMFREWAANIKLLRRPSRKAAPRYVPQHPATPAKSSGHKQTQRTSSAPPSSPFQVHMWYAAKDTSRPGGYVYKDVAESYNHNNLGSIKQFSSLAAARK